MAAALGIDLGGGSLRVGVVSPAGEVLQLATQRHTTGAEADPKEWWDALLRLLAALDLTDIAGVGLSGFGRSQVLADAAERPLRPAICFADTRAGAQAAAMGHVARNTWTAMSAWHPLARLAWVAEHEPAVFAATRMLLQPKDWLALQLTGQAATDRIGAAWALDAKGRMRNLAPFNRAGVDPGLLPLLLDPWEEVGRVRSVPALAGARVFIGGLDTWCATLGAGVGEADGYVVTGTTEVAGMLSRELLTLEGRVTLPWGEGLFHTGGPSGAGGACLDWLAEILGLRDAAAVAAMAGTAGEADLPLFLPDLDGVRAPLWQAAARGAFFGLAAQHGAAEMARAVLEGVALSNAAVLEGMAPARVVVAGGGARSDLWCQIRADVLGVDIVRATAEEPGVVGAALAAFVGLGTHADLAAAREVAGQGGRVFRPVPAAAVGYRALLPLFTAARAAALPIAAELPRLHTKS